MDRTEKRKCNACQFFRHISLFNIKNDRPVAECKKCIIARVLAWQRNNPEKHRVKQAKWDCKNKDKLKAKANRYYHRHKRKIYADPQKRIARGYRSRLSNLVKKGRAKHSVDYLGCSYEHLKSHLESLFKPGMTWDNYGIKGWHIYHIKPIKLFDLTKESELHTVFHYTNLQPLWAFDNLSKGAKY